ncbi:hypothetical protein C9374_014369 [Naegleria lovaniensis]|uniref:Uncharacterized protein n=1 Tax=Naegleria lovaniensis TaxID=51637 RepID=A0AA88H0D8_NAELO|nr:uncharacterized protein C9374_014369 [Naegleria lovaniensis]KAG2388969.1 hypothetical protein C9374_014369 [Naegleria lovaniensis]
MPRKEKANHRSEYHHHHKARKEQRQTQDLNHDDPLPSQQQPKKRKLQQQDDSARNDSASSSSRMATTTPNVNQNNNQKRDDNRNTKKKNYEQNLLNRIERVFGQSSSSSSHHVNRNDRKNKPITQTQSTPPTNKTASSYASSSSSTTMNIPGFYFDETANRYFPIPKNGLERSILIGNSKDRMKNLQEHARLKEIGSSQQQPLSATHSNKKHFNSFTSQKNKIHSSIANNVNKKFSNVPSILMIEECKTQKKYHTSKAMTIFKSRLMHPTADAKNYYKHVHHRMKHFEIREKFSPLCEFTQKRREDGDHTQLHTEFTHSLNADEKRLTSLESEYTSNMCLFTVKKVDFNKLHNHSTLSFKDEVCIFSSDTQRDLCLSAMEGRHGERLLTTSLSSLSSPITNISPFHTTHRNNYSAQEFQFLVSCTGHAQNAGVLTKFSVFYEQDIPTPRNSIEDSHLSEKCHVSYQHLYSCRKKTLFWHSVHPNKRWCALGLSKGGVIIDLDRASSGDSKQCHIGYTSSYSYSDVLLTYWNPFVTERGELLYARRDGNVNLMDCRMRTTSNQNRQLQTSTIGEIQFSQGSFISDLKCVNEFQFIVKSIESPIQHSSHHYRPQFQLFDKRKLSQSLLNYELGTSLEQSRLAINSIKEERDNKMFLFDNYQYMICGGITNSGSVLRIWDVYKGGEPEMTILDLPHCNVSNLSETPNDYDDCPFVLMGIPGREQLILLKH